MDDLLSHHDAMRRIMTDCNALMTDHAPAGRVALLRARHEFARVFKLHMAAEDALVQQHLAGDRTEGVRAAATHYVREMRAIFHDYSAHVRRWSPDEVERDWPGYRQAVAALQIRLRARMTWEESVIFPLLRARIDGGAPTRHAA